MIFSTQSYLYFSNWHKNTGMQCKYNLLKKYIERQSSNEVHMIVVDSLNTRISKRYPVFAPRTLMPNASEKIDYKISSYHGYNTKILP